MKLKISRLFHWLYATLMFLPILMFVPSCLYYGFNEHATNETTTTINYKYQSNEVNNIDTDLVEGNIYHLDSFIFTEDTDLAATFYFTAIKFSNIEVNNNSVYFDSFDVNINETYYFVFLYSSGSGLDLTINFANNMDDSYVYFSTLRMNTKLTNVEFIYKNEMRSYFEEYGYLPQYTDYNVIESVDTNVQDTISNKMYQAWEGVWNLPLFQWTKNSFITAPFSYITGLFGLSSDNSINYVFTYFVSISICWLVFDLIMYVPNLAHRWLDRSAIE